MCKLQILFVYCGCERPVRNKKLLEINLSVMLCIGTLHCPVKIINIFTKLFVIVVDSL